MFFPGNKLMRNVLFGKKNEWEMFCTENKLKRNALFNK